MTYAPYTLDRAELHSRVELRVAPAPKPKKPQPRVWITADTHFAHAHIIDLCQRPFENVEQMDQVMADNWNRAVGIGDTVYHLGDFCLGNFDVALDILCELNGHIKLVPGGHDERWLRQFAKLKHVNDDFAEGMLEVLPPIYNLHHNGKHAVLCHYPLSSWEQQHYGAVMLHGHSHGRSGATPNRYDVGVDLNNFTPILMDEAIRLAETYVYGKAT